MTTTIGPALGHGPWTQQGVGATPGYDAIDFRRSVHGFQRGEGVSTYGSFRVSQRAAGANMSVDVNMDDGAHVRGDAVTLQGLYYVAPHAATINETISTADATNPRIDQVVLEVKDTQHDASGSSLAQTRVIAGTPTGGATLDNRTGAAALPSSALLLADVLVAASDTAISNSEIRDRRAFIAGVPPVLTAVDMVAFQPAPSLQQAAFSTGPTDLQQAVVLVKLERRIAAATRLRWRYRQGSGTALTGNYIFAVHDATGRKIVDTGSVAFTGATSSYQSRSETITATTFEAGWYFVLWGVDTTNAGTIDTLTWRTPGQNAPYPNVALISATGGVTAPSTVLGFSDMNGWTTNPAVDVPVCALSVG